MRRFTYKVTVEIKEERGIEDLECVGNPLPTKKTAKENAAEGALWYLKNTGYEVN